MPLLCTSYCQRAPLNMTCSGAGAEGAPGGGLQNAYTARPGKSCSGGSQSAEVLLSLVQDSGGSHDGKKPVYTYADNGDLDDISVALCKAVCDDTPGCEAFKWHADVGCRLLRDVDYSQCSGGSSWDTYEKQLDAVNTCGCAAGHVVDHN